jgi:hypothetical protein
MACSLALINRKFKNTMLALQVSYHPLTNIGKHNHTCVLLCPPRKHRYWPGSDCRPIIWHVRQARTIGVHAMNSAHPATKCQGCSTDTDLVVQDEQHVLFACQHFRNLRAQKPALFGMDWEPSLWRFFNEYKYSQAKVWTHWCG